VKKIIVLGAVVCLMLVSFVERVSAKPAPLSMQECAQLSQLAGHDNLLPLKAGGSFPNAPQGLEATEESSLKYLQAGSPNLTALKAGDDPGEVLTWVIVICVCVLLLRLVNVL